MQGIFTAIVPPRQAVYTLLLTMVFYRTLKIKDLPSILLQTVVRPSSCSAGNLFFGDVLSRMSITNILRR
ncbi:hypothetical protein KCP71_05175 [Salmonella enterica subsp. enterica]|nr:hypothetical protein KCP71_05175 [Salmonella enterica subsp. enterica]